MHTAQVLQNLQSEHCQILERLRATLTLEKEQALLEVRREGDEIRNKLATSHQSELAKIRGSCEVEKDKIVSDMETKRQQVE